MSKRIVCIGGGHCNCQVLKLLKKQIVENSSPFKITLVSDQDLSFYSGMLPGTISGLYKEDDLKVFLKPLAAWCEADFIQQKVNKIVGSENKLYLQDGSTVDYDVLVVNVGSKTRDTETIKGVWEHSLTTRPINDMINKIKNKEQQLLEKQIVPNVVICGAGAAGTELSFAFKQRWSDLFKQDIKVTLLSSKDEALTTENKQTKIILDQVMRDKGINVVTNARVQEVCEDKVKLVDGREIECNVAVWATGAEAHGISTESDLELLKGFFRVNNFMQSTSYANIFAGGDCVTMESYVDKPYPTKAGVYAVRAGPIIAENVFNFLTDKPLVEYVPQSGFLSLMMTGDGSCVGSKYGIGFQGKWVWKLKDYIDMSFMNLFNPNYLFEDYANQGTKVPLPNFNMFDDTTDEERDTIAKLKEMVKTIDIKQAAQTIACPPEEVEFQERWQIIQRMHTDLEFQSKVVDQYCELFQDKLDKSVGKS